MAQIDPCNWHILGDEVACASIQKNASTSLTATFPRVGAELILEYPVRVAWIRNPISRLRSAYQYFQGAGRGYIPAEAVATWSRFVDYILENQDVHWCSQHEVLCFNGLFIPNALERFEDLGETWHTYCERCLPVINATERWSCVSDYRHAELEELFAKDFELWQQIPCVLERSVV